MKVKRNYDTTLVITMKECERVNIRMAIRYVLDRFNEEPYRNSEYLQSLSEHLAKIYSDLSYENMEVL